MRILVRADDGDQIMINADDLATEQQLVRLDFFNSCFGEDDVESIALPTSRARELAAAILTIADAVEAFEFDRFNHAFEPQLASDETQKPVR